MNAPGSDLDRPADGAAKQRGPLRGACGILEAAATRDMWRRSAWADLPHTKYSASWSQTTVAGSLAFAPEFAAAIRAPAGRLRALEA